MTAQTPLETVELLDEAFNRSDIEAVVNFYEEDAVMVAEPTDLQPEKPKFGQPTNGFLRILKELPHKRKRT